MVDYAGWGIIGTGKIARLFARDVQDSRLGRVVAVGSRTAQRAELFANEFGISRWYASYDELIVDPGVEFVYVATPHPSHAALAMQAASARKHVLCEKPLAVEAGSARRMVDHARSNKTFLMEAFAFRCHPQTHRLVQILNYDEIGEIRSISATFGYDAGPAPTNYLLRNDLAGGSILDVGCYTIALTRQLAGICTGALFRNPARVVGAGLLDSKNGVDLDAAAVEWFDDGLTCQVMSSIRTNLDSTVDITGTGGFIRLPAPWLPGRNGDAPRIEIRRHRGPAREVKIGDARGLYGIEADTVVARVREGRLEAPEMSWSDSIGNMDVLDTWRSQVGVRYAQLDGAISAAAQGA